MVERRLYAALASVALVTGCSFAPVYRTPDVDMPVAFKEAGAWRLATPADRMPRDAWWSVYRDPTLDALEPKVAEANPDAAAAVARHDEAAAYLDEARAGLFPTIGVTADASTNRQSARRPLRGANQPSVYGSNTAEAGIGYDLDLWGKVRNEVKAGRDELQASADDLASARLSLQASLADAYFHLRGLDQQQQLLSDTIRTYERALALTMSRHAGGIASDLDVSRAQTQLDSARASAEDVRARRALYEHAIAMLIGVPASSFTLAPSLARAHLPSIPAGVPAALLQRRPDVAAAERRVAEANAKIGVAKAAFFPDLSLELAGGFQSDTLSPWIAAPNEIWSVGPSLAMTLFDGGRRAAATQRARAKLAESGARYKAVVLQAFQQVEDNLALLHHLGDEATREHEALRAAQRALELSTSRYRDGVVSYLDVVTSQTTELDIEIAALDLDTRRVLASVRLIEALGGGWRANDSRQSGAAAATHAAEDSHAASVASSPPAGNAANAPRRRG
ncbi:efflux transporter outer membrane subunit [Burkholderia thailandensis]|uniref:efflux transporter outer membrane subunit n=1 Tax=Burkholderia thailandensis TaxID=57975 RepID=UPI0007548FEB|nr:efflux transporter outer membrane subunit [Burkholderia thailandensis]KVG10016.1 RND transporter [Burkholderia thailandensis]